jgi:hypothetical protein
MNKNDVTTDLEKAQYNKLQEMKRKCDVLENTPITVDAFGATAPIEFKPCDIAMLSAIDNKLKYGGNAAFITKAGAKVSIGGSTVFDLMDELGTEYLKITDYYYDQVVSINSASTVSAVNAITWSYTS